MGGRSLVIIGVRVSVNPELGRYLKVETSSDPRVTAQQLLVPTVLVLRDDN